MAEMIIQNPSITTNVFEYDEVGRVSAISGHPLAGQGGGTIVKSDLMWKPDVGSDGYVHWTLASSATTPDAAYISGAQGPAGPQGISGNPGKNPEFRINPSNAEWQWKYSGDAEWTDLGVVASGAVGPQGLSGNSGKDGISPTVSTSVIPGGNRVTFTYGEGSSTYIDVMSGASGANGINGISPTVSTETIAGGNKVIFTYGEGSTESIDVMSGASGANGSDGFSPIVTVTNIPADPSDPNHKKGGTEITITDATTTNKFSAWNGNDGTMAGAPDIEGKNGISAVLDGSTYEVGLSSEFYKAVTSVSSKLDESDFTTYTATTAPGAFQPKGNYATTSDISDMATKTWVEGKQYLVANDIVGKADKTDLQYVSAGVDYVSAHIPSLNGYATEQYVQGASAEVTAWVNNQGYLDSTAAAQTYQTKSDMTNYLTTSDAAATYQPKGNYATSSDIAGMATQTWVGQQGFITKDVNDLTYYYKKTETSGASELSTEFAKYVTKPDSSLVNKYLVLRTDNAGNVSGWCDFQDQSYSKSEANGTFVATANIDTTTLSGDGKSVSTKLGVKTDVIPTKDWLDDNYLPLSGSTVSGQLILSAATGTFDNSYIKCINNANVGNAIFGLGSQGGAIIKTVDGNNNSVQVNVNAGSDNSQLINVKTNNGITNVGYLIPAMVEQAGWTPSTDDKILHIVLES